MKMGTMDTIAMLLVIIGALSWGLMGLLGINLVDSLVGGLGTTVVNIVYDLVGLSGLYMLWSWYAKSKKK